MPSGSSPSKAPRKTAPSTISGSRPARRPAGIRAAYLGVSGWLGVELDDDAARVGKMLDMSYGLTAPKRAIGALDTLR